jgi:diacylglycerol O-acyltransferase / wax synthase
MTRLSALDASFLAVESPAAPMHVGWVSSFDPPEEGPRPGFPTFFDFLAGRLANAPRWRQKLEPVPLGLTEPAWIDDPDFDPAEHILHARGDDLDALVDEIFSEPLPRDRPLWQFWIADELPEGRVAMICKAHHCMVDGLAIAELGKLILDTSPDGAEYPEADAWEPRPPRSSRSRFARAVADRAADGAAIALAPVKLASSPGRLRGVPRLARTFAHTLLPPAPGSPLNQPGSPRRHHIRMSRPLDELRTIRRRFGVAPNDVVLAACAGALRTFAGPRRLKVMVPADVRGAGDSESGNRISFVFFELPCDEPDPVARLEAVHAATSGRAGDGEGLDATLRALSLAPSSVKLVLAHAFAHPRMSNLTISSVPGPATARYMEGCKLRTIHSAVPLAERHALSIGVVMTAGRACFGIYADADTLPDAELLRDDLDAAFDELLSA